MGICIAHIIKKTSNALIALDMIIARVFGYALRQSSMRFDCCIMVTLVRSFARKRLASVAAEVWDLGHEGCSSGCVQSDEQRKRQCGNDD